MNVTIRRAEPRDSEALGHLGAMLMRTHYAFDPLRFLEPQESVESGYASFLTSVARRPDSRVFVAESEGDIIGYTFVALEPLSWKELRGPAGFIHDIAVRENARGAGAGRALLDTATAWLREQGAPRVILWTAAPNEEAQRLFRRTGFRDTMIEMTMEL
jgi:GNAT superfamily N-acetyltransferase